MKRHLGLIGMLGVALGMVGCGQSDGAGGASSDEEQATLVAALAANDDGSDDAWTSVGEPFLVPGCGFGAIVTSVVERFDADGSGDLDADERAALAAEFGDPSERFDLLVSIYDTDGSGGLEASELDAVKADIEARCESRREALLERFDADGDGTLDDEELEAARDALRERLAARVGRGIGRGIGRGDGIGAAGRPGGRGIGIGIGIGERLAERRAAIAEEFDADQNGELDAAEREALAEHLRACVRGEESLLP